MSDHILQVMNEAEKGVEKAIVELRDAQKFVNQLCKMAGRPPKYSVEDLASEQPSGATGVVRGDEYYGKPLATVVQQILEARKNSGQGPATIAELFDAMVAGGYHFETKSRDNSLRGLRISISKNSAKFHRLPTGGKIGLLSWYPTAKEARPSKNGKKDDEDIAHTLSSEFSSDEDEGMELSEVMKYKPK